MSNVTMFKSTKTKCESPKTPGGISKSLLTPCRRVGLSRKWRNAGPSPFISPLAGDNSTRPEVVIDNKPSRKKPRVVNTEVEEAIASKTTQGDEDVENIDKTNVPVETPADIVATPTRSVQIPRKSKSRASIRDNISVEGKPKNYISKIVVETKEDSPKEVSVIENIEAIDLEEETIESNEDFTSKPVRNNSVKTPIINKAQNTKDFDAYPTESLDIKDATVSKPKKSKSILASKHKSPNNLTKECVVVIQKKINKNILKSKNNAIATDDKVSGGAKSTLNPVSQALFDSDSDEAPLSAINKKNSTQKGIETKKRSRDVLDDDEDFHENTKVSKQAEKEHQINNNTSNKDLKIKINKKTLQIVKKPPPQKLTTQAMIHIDEPSSQDSYDNDDDFDFDTKKTILIRKTYEKVAKPQKAKSTGSVTQRDIEELKARLEMKKKQLLAKSMTQDTEELRNLIKKWKRGCQDALVELMELMKRKCPEKCMQYSEILKMLKIPAGLVGYDSDNDSFVSPDDASIILSKFDS